MQQTESQTNLKGVQIVSKYHLNYQNDPTKLKCNFVNHNLPKNSKSVKKALQDRKWQPSVLVPQTLFQTNLKRVQNVCKLSKRSNNA